MIYLENVKGLLSVKEEMQTVMKYIIEAAWGHIDIMREKRVDNRNNKERYSVAGCMSKCLSERIRS